MQLACRYGLVIGSFMAWPVRVLMLFTSPISYPIAKLLDFVLGGEHASLFRRKQLKALVTLHARDEGFGGRLTADEIQIITGEGGSSIPLLLARARAWSARSVRLACPCNARVGRREDACLSVVHRFGVRVCCAHTRLAWVGPRARECCMRVPQARWTSRARRRSRP